MMDAKTQRGLSMVELVIAMAIAAVLAPALFAAVSAMITVPVRGADTLSASRDVNHAVELIARDAARAQMFDYVDSDDPRFGIYYGVFYWTDASGDHAVSYFREYETETRTNNLIRDERISVDGVEIDSLKTITASGIGRYADVRIEVDDETEPTLVQGIVRSTRGAAGPETVREASIYASLRVSTAGAGGGGALPELESLVIAPGAETAVVVGGLRGQQYRAYANYTGNTTVNITDLATWTSTDGNVASINPSGLARGIALGTAQIYASFEGRQSNSATLNVVERIVTDIALRPALAALVCGDTLALEAKAIYSDDTESTIPAADVLWQSLDESIARVTGPGLVTAQVLTDPRTATIRASYGGETASAAIRVLNLGSIYVPAFSILEGSSYQCKAYGVLDAGQGEQDLTDLVAWRSSDESVAAISPTGMATGLAPGATTIVATLGSMSGSAPLYVLPSSLVAIAIGAGQTSIEKGETYTFTVTGITSSGTVPITANWQSSNEDVATIDEASGEVTGVGPGTTTITAILGTMSDTTSLDVLAIESISLTPASTSIRVGDSLEYTVQGTFSNGAIQSTRAMASSTLAWRQTEGPGVIVFVQPGKVTGSATGEVTVEATFDAVAGSAALTVLPADLVEITVSPQGPMIDKYETQQFQALGKYSDGTSGVDITGTVDWQSGNVLVATVSAGGLATGTGGGSVSITAEDTQSGLTGSVTLTVVALESITVSPSAATIRKGATQRFTAEGTFTFGDTRDLTNSVAWSSSPTEVAIVGTQAPAVGWYNTAWPYRQEIVIADMVDGSSALTNFPLLVRVTDGANPLFGKAQASGGDILFTSADAVTRLDHQLEHYSGSATKELDAWVRIPTLSGSGATKIYMYYGNPSAPSQQNTAGVWGSEYKAVYHLGEFPSSPGTLVRDSSTVGNDVALGSLPPNAVPTWSPGKVNGGIRFDGTDDYLEIPHRSDYLLAQGTISFWFKADSAARAQGLFSKDAYGRGAGQLTVRAWPGPSAPIGSQLIVGAYVESATQAPNPMTALSFSPSAWHHVAVEVGAPWTRGWILAKLYFDGAWLYGLVWNTGWEGNQQPIALGASTASSGNLTVEPLIEFFGGVMDEVRVEGVARGDSWVKATYRNQLDNTFLTLNPETHYAGAAVGVGGGTSTITASLDGKSDSRTLEVLTVESISVVPDTATIKKGESQSFRAFANYPDAGPEFEITDRASWTSALPGVAAVQSGFPNGGLTFGAAVSGGPVAIRAELDGVTGEAGLTVLPPTLVSISVTPEEERIKGPIGETRQFTALGTYSDGTEDVDITGEVDWTSTMESVATIQSGVSGGLATAQGQGITEIYASLAGVESNHATLSVTTLDSISIVPMETCIEPGSSQIYEATGYYSDGSFEDVTDAATWKIDNPTVAETVGSGVVRGISTGSTKIRAEIGTMKSSKGDIYVEWIEAISIAPAGLSTIREGETKGQDPGDEYQVSADFPRSHTHSLPRGYVTWNSSDAGIASIVGPGLALGTGEGTAEIFGRLRELESNHVPLGVRVLKTIDVVPDGGLITLRVGDDLEYTATGTYENFGDMETRPLTGLVAWSSTNSSAATIQAPVLPDQPALVTALGTGDTAVTASLGGVQGSSPLTVTPPTLEQIILEPTSTTKEVGQTIQYQATGYYSDASSVDVTSSAIWESSEVGVATIESGGPGGGRATAIAVGTTSITARLDDVESLPVDFTVDPPSLREIEIDPVAADVTDGSDRQFWAIGRYGDALEEADITSSATWSTLDPGVVSVASAPGPGGLVTGLRVGVATIVAELDGISAQATATVLPALLSISVEPTTGTQPAGYGQQYRAFANYSDNSRQDVTTVAGWESTDTDVATVQSGIPNGGLVKAESVGEVLITARFGGLEGAASFSVTDPLLLEISVSPGNTLIANSETAQYRAWGSYSDATNQDITALVEWNTSDPAVATIDSSGLATATGPGSVEIWAEKDGRTSTRANLLVLVSRLDAVIVEPTEISAPLGTVVQYRATGRYSGGFPDEELTALVTWTSSAPGVADFLDPAGNPGLVTGLTLGTSEIRADLVGRGSLPVTLRVVPVVLEGVHIVPDEVSLIQGDTFDFQGKADYSNGESVLIVGEGVWTSDDPAVATIDGSGRATVAGTGTTNIRFAWQGEMAEAIINVLDLEAIRIEPTLAAMQVGNTTQYRALGRYAGSWRDISDRVAWVSLDEGVATISASGLATGVDLGITYLQASWEGQVSERAMVGVGDVGIYVVDSGSDSVFRYDVAGTLQQGWSLFVSVSPNPTNEEPQGIAYGGYFFWVVDSGQRKVFKYTTFGWVDRQYDLNENNTSPRGISYRDGLIWIVDDSAGTVYVYDRDFGRDGLPDRGLLYSWPLDGANTQPLGIAVSGGYAWVVDAGGAVYQYSADVGALAAIWQLDEGNSSPRGIATDGERFWVADSARMAYVYTTDGTLEASWSLHTDNGDPRGIAVFMP